MIKEKFGAFFNKSEKKFKIAFSVSLVINFLLIIFGTYLLYSFKSERDSLREEANLKDVEIRQLQDQIKALREEKEEGKKGEETCTVNLDKALDFSKKQTIASRTSYQQCCISIEVPDTWCSLDKTAVFFTTPDGEEIGINLSPWIGGLPPGIDIQYRDEKSIINEIEITKRIFLENEKYTSMRAMFDVEYQGKTMINNIAFSFPKTRQKEFMDLYDEILATVKAISLEEAEEIWE